MIRWYQELYAEYSRRGLSHDEDRPRAILGLESRLRTGFGTDGGHGILYHRQKVGLLQRSLLWRRGVDVTSLTPIKFPPDREAAPSWSWMAYKGGIDYLKVEGGTLDWKTTELRSPWSRKRNADKAGGADEEEDIEDEEEEFTDQEMYDDDEEKVPEYDKEDEDEGYEDKCEDFYGSPAVDGDPNTVLTAVARDFTKHLTGNAESELIYDRGSIVREKAFKCVVVGREKDRLQWHMTKKLHYVLLVAPVSSTSWPGVGAVRGAEVYERIGVGMIPGRCIALRKKGLTVKIV